MHMQTLHNLQFGYYSKFDKHQNFIFVHKTYLLSNIRNFATDIKQNHHCANSPSFFRVACECFSQTCRNDGNPLKLKLPFFIDCCLPYPIPSFNTSYWFIQLQNCFDNRNVDTFVSKLHFCKFSKICDFWLKA